MNWKNTQIIWLGLMCAKVGNDSCEVLHPPTGEESSGCCRKQGVWILDVKVVGTE